MLILLGTHHSREADALALDWVVDPEGVVRGVRITPASVL